MRLSGAALLTALLLASLGAAAPRSRPEVVAARALAPWLVPGAVPSPVASPDGSQAFELLLPEVSEEQPLVLLLTGAAQGWFADLGVPPSPWASGPPAQRLVSFRVFDPGSGALHCGRALLEPSLSGGELVFGSLTEVQLFDGFESPRLCASVEGPAGIPDPRDPQPVTVRLAVREAAPAGGEPPPAQLHRWRERWTFDGPEPLEELDDLGREAPKRPVVDRAWAVAVRDARGRERLELSSWALPREGWPRAAAGWALVEPRLELLDSERRGEVLRVRLRAPDMESFRRLLPTIERTVRILKVVPQRADDEGRVSFRVECGVEPPAARPTGATRGAPAGDEAPFEPGPRAARAVAERLAPYLREGSKASYARSPDASLAFRLETAGAGSRDDDEPPPMLMVTGLLDGSFVELGGLAPQPGQAPPAQRLVGLRLLEASGALQCGHALLTPVLVNGELVFGGLRQLRLEEAEGDPWACGALVVARAGEEEDELPPNSWARELVLRREDGGGDALEAWLEQRRQELVGDTAEAVGEPRRVSVSAGTAPWLYLRVSGIDDEELVVGGLSAETDVEDVPELALLLDELPGTEVLRLDRGASRWLLEARLPDRLVALRAMKLMRERLPLIEIRLEHAEAPGPARPADGTAIVRAAFRPLK